MVMNSLELTRLFSTRWYVFWHPKNFTQFLTLGMRITGLLSSVYLAAKFAWRNVSKVKGQIIGLHPLKTVKEIQEEQNFLEERLKKHYRSFAGRDSGSPLSLSGLS